MRRLFKLRATRSSGTRRYPELYERLLPIVLGVVAVLVFGTLIIIALVLAGVVSG